MAYHLSDQAAGLLRRRQASSSPRRPRFRAARAFYLTLFLFTCFATFALFTRPYNDAPRPSANLRLSGRSLDGPVGTLDADEHCRLVHRAPDQCAFVHKHCPADEGGFSDYLDLYFCKLAHVKPIAAFILVAWLGLLFSTIGIAASDFFCIDLSTIASILGMSESIAGVTFLAFGNGSPDVFSTFAAMSTHSGSLAVGELFGAAGFITAVVAGSMALIRPFKVSKKSFVRDVSFFIVAAGFSLKYLWDGKLRFWECVSMVGFYIFYVVFILVWHWWFARRRQRREREALIRGHFAPADEREFEDEEYRDDPDEDTSSQRPSSIPRGVSRDEWSALEMASETSHVDVPDGRGKDDEEEEEEERERWMSEIASQMRLTRPEFGPRARKNTITPVRPSLVGALEFQAVLKSLEKSRNLQTAPLMLRRFSDDPNFLLSQQDDRLSVAVSDSVPWYAADRRPSIQFNPSVERTSLDVPTTTLPVPGRARAVSANDAAGLQLDPTLGRFTRPQFQSNLVDISDVESDSPQPSSHQAPSGAVNVPPKSPVVQVEPATPLPDAPIHSYNTATPDSPNLLAPPGVRTPLRSNDHYFSARQSHPQGQDSQHASPKARHIPQLVISDDQASHVSSPAHSPFPRFEDSPVFGGPRSPVHSRPPSLYLPGPLVSPGTFPSRHSQSISASARPSKWWPYSIFPPPDIIVSALFPTIYHWHEKSWWEKCLGLVAVPSVFLLTITLPVVENDKDFESDHLAPSQQRPLDVDTSKGFHGASNDMSSVVTNGTDGASSVVTNHEGDRLLPGIAGHGSTATAAAHAEEHAQNHIVSPAPHTSFSFDPQLENSPASVPANCPPQLWNRWLTIVQLFLAPQFILLSIYIQSPVDLSASSLVLPVLICLLASTVLLIPLLCTSTPTRRPRIYRIILSLAGFVVSIAWISTVASQVVGALKALAVILNMSHAIMGLTIFAVGNSLGDLVADVTVARLGYPIMALSACFGGPMLNILLGIGLSGSYMLIQGAERRHEKHPEKGMHFKVYHIEVSKTLIISGVTLLVTLVGLLIAVPLNKWMFSRRIGWALIVLWTLTTVGNVIVEVTGWPADTESRARWLATGTGNGI